MKEIKPTAASVPSADVAARPALSASQQQARARLRRLFRNASAAPGDRYLHELLARHRGVPAP